MSTVKKLKIASLSLVASLFVINGLGSFLRYTEIYTWVKPQLWAMILRPRYFHHLERYTPFLPHMGKHDPVGVMTDDFDFLYWEFNLFPRKVIKVYPPPWKGDSYSWFIINRSVPASTPTLEAMEAHQWRKVQDWKDSEDSGLGKFQLWRKTAERSLPGL